MNATQSAIPGIVWPHLQVKPDTALGSLLFHLGRTQWWTPQRLREAQLRQLHVLLRHTHSQSQFYRERMLACEFNPSADFGWDEFARLPRLTREELQRHGVTLNCQALPPGHGEISSTTSSGSTGRPVTVLSTELMGNMFGAMTLRDHLWHRRDLSLKLASMRNRVVEQEFASWGLPASALTVTGPGVTFAIHDSTVRQVQWLLKQQPGYLLTYPTNLDAILHYCREREIRIPGLREARTFAESLPANLRALCREIWGVPLTDMYSAHEVGYIALQCPAGPHYHVQAENVLVEVLDSEGGACPPGQQGQVVLTSLNNFATPLIRYEIGDIAIPGAACTCGRGLPVIERVIGRVRNMLTLPDGERRFPSFDSRFYAGLEPVRQFQIVQKTRRLLELRVVVERPPSADEELAIKRRLLDRLQHEFEIHLVLVDSIPRGPGGKYEDFSSEIGAAVVP